MSPSQRLSYLQGISQIAFDSLLRHRLRSFLSILGVICGVAAVFATLSIGEGAKREVLDSIRRLGLENIIVRGLISPLAKSKTSGLPSRSGLRRSDVSLLQSASPAIVAVSSLKELVVKLPGLELKPQVLAISANYLKLQGVGVVQGRGMVAGDEQRARMICLLGEALAADLGSRGQVGQSLRLGDQLFLIVGIVRAGASSDPGAEGGVAQVRDLGQTIFIPFGSHAYLRDGGGGRAEQVDELIIKMRSQEEAEGIVPLIERSLALNRDSAGDYQLIVPYQLLHQAQKTQRIFNLVLASLGGISLLVGGIGIMNVLLASISERTREIGIRRAVGASRNDIVAQFVAEALLLTCGGGLLGIGGGLLASYSIARLAAWPMAVSPLTLLLPLLTSLVVGACAGIYPALKAGAMDPVVALRSA